MASVIQGDSMPRVQPTALGLCVRGAISCRVHESRTVMISRAFTLLELLVAITILTAMTGLVAAMWGQMANWSAQNAQLQHSLRLQQAIEFMHHQWASRLAPIAPDQNSDSPVNWQATATDLQFLTTAPALFPDWPIVSVKYRVQHEPVAGPEDQIPAKLIYEELRVTDLDHIVDVELDSLGQTATQRLVLLDDCQGLRWQAWHEVSATDHRADTEQTSIADSWDDVTTTDKDLESGTDPEASHTDTPQAVRLTGFHNQREFTCTFVAQGSH